MRSSKHWLKQVAMALVFLLAFPVSESGMALGQAAPGAAARVAADSSHASEAYPATGADNTGAVPEAPLAAGPQAGVGQPATTPQAGDSQGQPNPRKPVGAAAAPYEPTMGIAASRPAGAAIAPAKQRRVRTILISLGVVAGAGIAIGSVAALSHGSPSHP